MKSIEDIKNLINNAKLDYDSHKDEYELLDNIKKYINIDFHKLEKDIKKFENKEFKSVMVNGVVYHSLKDFEGAYQSGLIDNINMDKYDKIIEKLTININELNPKTEYLKKIQGFLNYYINSDTIIDLYNWYQKNMVKCNDISRNDGGKYE